MGILNRFKDIMDANINALLDKCEDPAKMVDQQLRDLRENLADVKRETANVMASEKQAVRLVDECKANIAKYGASAMNAVKAGNDGDARTLLAAKQKEEARLPSLEATAAAASANSDKMRQMHDKLTSDIRDMEARKDAIKAKMAVAGAQQAVNRMTAGSKASEASVAAFERMEAKADKALDQAMAEAELTAGTTSADDLAAAYAGDGSASVEDELARMKASLQQ